MRCLHKGHYLFIALIGLVLIVNQILIHIRHNSTVYRKYYHDGPQNSLIYASVLQSPNKTLESISTGQFSKTVPIHNVGSNYDKFNDVIPRTAYYGVRYIAGSKQNVVIVLAEVSATILEQKLIVSCGWKNQYSTAVKVVTDPLMRWIQKNKRGYTHFFAIIYCFGLTIIRNDVVKIIYKSGTDGPYRSVDTEKSVRLLNNASHIKKVNSVLACATMYGHPIRFEEWLRYQKTLGVDGIHLNVQLSFVVGIEKYPFLIESLQNEFVKIEVWKQYLKSSAIFYYSQSLIYQDCVMQYQASFEYIMMVDYDDFFIPAVPNQKNVHYYVNRFFNERTASVRLPWIELPCAVKNYTFLVDGNVTQTFSTQDTRIKRRESKSIHRLNAVDIVSIHQAFKVLPGYSKVQIEGVNLAYFAHIRPRTPLCTTVK